MGKVFAHGLSKFAFNYLHLIRWVI